MCSQRNIAVQLMPPCLACWGGWGAADPALSPQAGSARIRPTHHSRLVLILLPSAWCGVSPSPAGFSSIRLPGSNQICHLLLLGALSKLFTSFESLFLSYKIRIIVESWRGKHLVEWLTGKHSKNNNYYYYKDSPSSSCV